MEKIIEKLCCLFGTSDGIIQRGGLSLRGRCDRSNPFSFHKGLLRPDKSGLAMTISESEIRNLNSDRFLPSTVVLFIFFLVILAGQSNLHAQNLPLKDTLVYAEPWPAILRSAVIPGWGQMYQERLWPSALLYFSSARYVYKTISYYNKYSKSDDSNQKKKFQENLSVSLILYTLNLIDVSYAAFYKKPQQWSGGLFSDKPLKSPWGAALRSAVLPGWGQCYTESYWKAAGYFLTAGYFVYQIREADLVYQKTRTSSNRNTRSKFAWYFGLAYFINIADAYAGAYLYKFDEAVKLTVSPEITPNSSGVALNVYF